MYNLMRKLPIGIQTFEKIREGNYLYVDKTAFVWKITQTETPHFLIRPRRFGKSLFLSTLESYFLGKKELFKGLAIEKMETEWSVHPVLHLDLNAKKYDTIDDLYAIFNQYLEGWEATYGDEKKDRSPEERLTYVITRAYEKTGKGVVVLVDEYDKPLLQSLENPELLEQFRMTLKAFYGALKSADRYLRFVFLTGVTKFSQVSVFSDLNQLNDISMKAPYATICGITQQELVNTFTPELTALAKAQQLTFEETVQKMASTYDGYHFCEFAEGVFNPFSVLNAFDGEKFENYWFQTGTPTFLIHLLQKSEYDLRTLLDGIEVPVTSFSEYRMNADNPIPLIYQSGYLTIKDFDKEFQNYLLGFPNDEVRYGFINFLIPFYTPMKNSDQGFYIGKFIQELRVGNYEAFLTRLEAFFADIPYELNDRTERHYQVIFYLVFKLMGQFTGAEVRSARGRADAVVKTPKYIYVFEFKLKGTAEEALAQIDEKGYLIPYQADGREVVKVGVEFSAASRNISRWLVR